jgi:lysozyme
VTTAIDYAVPRLKVEEGFRSQPYTDTRGYLTVGYGWNTSAGLTEFAAAALLTAQVQELHNALLTYQWYSNLDPVRQSACLDIAFNEGLHEFVNDWPLLIAALTAGNWQAAQKQAHTATVEDQPRYTALGQIFLTGEAA